MPDFTNKGGFIYSTKNKDVCAAVEGVHIRRIRGNAATWNVYLKDVPRDEDFNKNDNLIYNAKGTSNSNADNALMVQSKMGPCHYICLGPWPGNI